MATNSPKVCVIGAGPSGMSALYNLNAAKQNGRNVDMVCFEKQEDWGGMWNFSWRTGCDEYGELLPNSMYRNLWTNAPKEALEMHDYTLDEHFGRPVPSFAPREVIRDYMTARWERASLSKYIQYRHVVRSVRYRSQTSDFQVDVHDLANDTLLESQTFTHVFVCTGHFSAPTMPSFPGLNTFPGRVLHSHDFRDSQQFSGLRVLVVGSSFSGQDISIQCVKHGAKSVLCTYHSAPSKYACKYPAGVTERPPLVKVEGKKASFKDGSCDEVDAIIMCTGYRHHYPFLSDELRLRCNNHLYPPGLYKGVLWTQGGGDRLFYIGPQNQFYTLPMFDLQSRWAVSVVLGEVVLPGRDERSADMSRWSERVAKVTDLHLGIDLQSDYLQELADLLDVSQYRDLRQNWHSWEDHRLSDLSTYRDNVFPSIYTGTTSTLLRQKWFDTMDTQDAIFSKNRF